MSAIDQLPPRHRAFVGEYLKDLNATKAYLRSCEGKKISEESARRAASRLLTSVDVQAAITEQQQARMKRLEVEGDEVVNRLWSILRADHNELVQLRRVCCPSCYGKGHQRQYTPIGYQDAKARHDKERARLLSRTKEAVDIGEFPSHKGDWYDKRKPPKAGCPECWGEGLAEVFFCDTRTLSPAAKLLFNGIKQGRDGLEVMTFSKEKAAEMLGRHLGLFVDKVEVSGPQNIDTAALAKQFDETMKRARERQAAVNKVRGLDGGDDHG